MDDLPQPETARIEKLEDRPVAERQGVWEETFKHSPDLSQAQDGGEGAGFMGTGFRPTFCGIKQEEMVLGQEGEEDPRLGYEQPFCGRGEGSFLNLLQIVLPVGWGNIFGSFSPF